MTAVASATQPRHRPESPEPPARTVHEQGARDERDDHRGPGRSRPVRRDEGSAARSLAERMVTVGRVTDLDGFLADVAAREAQMPTGLDGGIGIPHCRSEHVTEPTLAFGRSAAGIDFGAPDGPADLIFLIAAPGRAPTTTTSPSCRPGPAADGRRLHDAHCGGGRRGGRGRADPRRRVRGEEPPRRSTPRLSRRRPRRLRDGCSSGTVPAGRTAPPAHRPTNPSVSSPSPPVRPASRTPTWPPSRWQNAGRAAGVELVVETQGSAGFTRLDPAVIAAADGVIFAHDVARTGEGHGSPGSPPSTSA